MRGLGFFVKFILFIVFALALAYGVNEYRELKDMENTVVEEGLL